MLPYVLAFNMSHAPEATDRIAAAFGSSTALEGLQQLRRVLDAPQRLSDLGFTAEGIPEAVEIARQPSPPTIPARSRRRT